jgi:hypothetical protein
MSFFKKIITSMVLKIKNLRNFCSTDIITSSCSSSFPRPDADVFRRYSNVKYQPTVDDPLNPKNCVILVPCNSAIEHKTDESLRILEARGYEVWRTPGWSAIDQGRNRMAYDAIYVRGFKEVLWIDSDIAFNPDDVERIRKWNKDIVAGAYPMKGWPIMTVQPLPGKSVSFVENGTLEEVMCAATGFLYIKANVFKTIQSELKLPECNTSFSAPQIPFFQPAIWDIGSNKSYLGEDFSFCMRARQCGYAIWLDTGIKLGHIGKYTYEWEDVIKKTGQSPKISGTSNFVYTPSSILGSS